MKSKSVVFSRTDSIGDVVLTLPLVGYYKKLFPDTKIIFLGRNYTLPILACCPEIDEIWSFDDEQLSEKCKIAKPDAIYHVFPKKEIAKWAKNMKIPLRIGTNSRWYHWFYCNKLVSLSRKNSEFHEAQLNIKLITQNDNLPTIKELPNFFNFKSPLPESQKFQIRQKYLHSDKFNLILHPKSQGSAREWLLQNFISLANNLPAEKFNLLISGTLADAKLMEKELQSFPSHAQSICGKLSLSEFIALIEMADGLVAASTGPLHIAAVSGIHTLGLYPPMRPIHPGRWAPIGEKAEFIVKNKTCSECKKSPISCRCIQDISVLEVSEKISNWLSTR